MTYFTDETYKYYKLGQFVAHMMLNGDIHPDMQLANIGSRNEKQLAFKDYADVIHLNIPNCLSADICDQLTISLMPIIKDIKDSFSKISCFRMGFIAFGGLLGHAIFLNALNRGVSSSWYTKCNFTTCSYDSSFLYLDRKSKLLIKNWKKLPLDKITLKEYPTHDEYERSKEHFHILDINCYYLDILYYCHSYIWRSNFLYINSLNENSINQRCSVISALKSSCNLYIEKMAEAALHYKHYYTAYGLFSRCQSEAHEDNDDQNKKVAQNGLNSISQSTHMSSSVCDFIMENLDLDLFEFMWLLDDLEHSHPI